MEAEITKWGNSLALRIPKAFAAQAGLTEGAPVELALEENGLSIRAARPTLKSLLAQVTPENLPDEMEWGQAQGREAW